MRRSRGSSAARATAAGPSPSEVSASTRAPRMQQRPDQIDARGHAATRSRHPAAPSRAVRPPARRRTAQAARASRRPARAAPASRRRREETDRRTRARRPCCPRSASTSRIAASNGLGQARASPLINIAASARCRLPPKTISASPIAPLGLLAETRYAVLADADDGQPACVWGRLSRQVQQAS